MSNVNADIENLKEAKNKLVSAHSILRSLYNKMYSNYTSNAYSGCLDSVEKSMSKMNTIFVQASNVTLKEKNTIGDIYSSLKKWEESKNNISNSATNSGSNSGTIIASAAKTSTETKNKKKKKKKKKKTKVKMKAYVKSLVSATTTTATATTLLSNTNSVVKPAVITAIDMLKNFESILKDGDTISAASSYVFLKKVGLEQEANELLSKYGYIVSTENGETVVYKYEESVIENQETTDDKTNSSDTEVVAEEKTVEESSSKDSQQQNTVEQQNSNVSSSESSNVTKVNESTSNNNQNAVSYNSNSNEQVSSESTGNATSQEQSIQEDISNSDTNGIVSDNDNSTIDDEIDSKKSSVISINDNNESTTKKTSGLGAAVPIGLGTIATGAAAVAGVRYVKNRHESQEEYNDDYDDENNGLDSDNEYVDSAKYDSGNDYTEDEYLGPAGSVYQEVNEEQIGDKIEEIYVDPEELEEYEELDEDSVLNELNSEY